jgi:hypothetical protein
MTLPKAQLKVLELALKVFPTAREAEVAVHSEDPENCKALKVELEALLAAEKVCLRLRKQGIHIAFADLVAKTGFTFPLSVTAHIEQRIDAALRSEKK